MIGGISVITYAAIAAPLQLTKAISVEIIRIANVENILTKSSKTVQVKHQIAIDD